MTKNTEQLEEIKDKKQEEEARRRSTKNRLTSKCRGFLKKFLKNVKNNKCRGFKENTTVYEGFKQNER